MNEIEEAATSITDASIPAGTAVLAVIGAAVVTFAGMKLADRVRVYRLNKTVTPVEIVK